MSSTDRSSESDPQTLPDVDKEGSGPSAKPEELANSGDVVPLADDEIENEQETDDQPNKA